MDKVIQTDEDEHLYARGRRKLRPSFAEGIGSDSVVSVFQPEQRSIGDLLVAGAPDSRGVPSL